MRSGIYFDEKLERRRRRLLKLKIYGGITAFFVLLIGIGYLIVYSPLFRITRIDADNKRINADEIVENLKNFFTNQSKIAQFLGPDNILVWSNEKIGEILSAKGGSASGGKNYPQIAELRIKKDYLERQIKIEITEREKLGIWCQQTRITRESEISESQISRGSLKEDQRVDSRNIVTDQRDSATCYWFDKAGIIFAEAPSVEGNLINKVDDFSGQSLKIGEIVIKENLFSNLVKIFDVLEKSDLKIKSFKLEKLELQEIIADSSGNLLPKIYFSLRIDPSFSLSALESFKNLGLEKIEYIDFRVENRAYYKMK